jgi:hypothetical protein
VFEGGEVAVDVERVFAESSDFVAWDNFGEAYGALCCVVCCVGSGFGGGVIYVEVLMGAAFDVGHDAPAPA